MLGLSGSTPAALGCGFQFCRTWLATRDGDPWFVLADVCKVLEHSNPSKAADGLEDDEWSKLSLGRQGMGIVIGEAGLYHLILRSDKPLAKAFQHWVAHDVLPIIRTTGAYVIPALTMPPTCAGSRPAGT